MEYTFSKVPNQTTFFNKLLKESLFIDFKPKIVSTLLG